MSNQSRRQQLYDLYSANIAFYAPQLAGHFACPICGRVFAREATLTKSLEVDLAHVYPKKCGGKLETLTCAKCNSTIGSKFDSQLTIEHRVHNGFRPGTNDPLSARLSFDGGSVGVKLSRDQGGGWNFHVVQGWTNPKERDALAK